MFETYVDKNLERESNQKLVIEAIYTVFGAPASWSSIKLGIIAFSTSNAEY